MRGPIFRKACHWSNDASFLCSGHSLKVNTLTHCLLINSDMPFSFLNTCVLWLLTHPVYTVLFIFKRNIFTNSHNIILWSICLEKINIQPKHTYKSKVWGWVTDLCLVLRKSSSSWSTTAPRLLIKQDMPRISTSRKRRRSESLLMIHSQSMAD